LGVCAVVTRIFAIATDGAACYLYRLHYPLNKLDPSRFEVHWSPPPPDPSLGDVVIGQRIAGKNTAWEEMCANPNLLAVYDLDDNLLEVDPSNSLPYSIYAPIAADTANNIRLANVVTVSTPKLAARMRELNPNVVVLPNCLPADWIASVRHQQGDEVIVGWAGSMFHQQDWPGVGQQLAIYAAHEPRARFHCIGANYMAPHVRARYTGWDIMENYWKAMDFSIGIAPLVDTPFNQCKSGIKVKEYFAQGVPAIASDIGEYADIIDHGVNGFLVREPDDWPKYLHALTDDTLREQMSNAAMLKALEFTIDKHVSKWEAVYEGSWQ